MKVEVGLANKALIHRIADNLRAADLRESACLTSATPRVALWQSCVVSKVSLIVQVDDEPVLVFGVSDTPGYPDVGSPWMMATPGLSKIYRRFILEKDDYMRFLWDAGPYLVLKNIADTRNTKHIRWLEWLGARFSGDKIMTHFQNFEIRR